MIFKSHPPVMKQREEMFMVMREASIGDWRDKVLLLGEVGNLRAIKP